MDNLKDTLHLPKTDMPINANLPMKEAAVYQSWDKGGVYQRMRRDGRDLFVLHDGPPYANGDIHIGHALNKILKDFAVKCQYFNGRAVEFVPGWDCHGLPIEQKVRSQKVQDPATFLAMCRRYASEQIAIQKEQFKSLGVLADWDHHYETMSPDFEAMIKRRLQELQDGGFLFRRKKPVYWSWAERTALAEAEVEYEDRKDKSIYLLFEQDGDGFGMLVWTTTPWTLPANVAVAVNPNVSYVIAKWHGRLVFTSEQSVGDLKAKGVGIQPVRAARVEEVLSVGAGYNLVHPIHKGSRVPVIVADFVDATMGTGCVHIAPAHGEDDYLLGVKNKLPMPMSVGVDGTFNDEPGAGPYVGLHVFDANDKIIDDLDATGRLVLVEEIVHSYPHCWRSHTPVIYRATEQWFLDLDKIRAMNPNPATALDDVYFHPENARNRMIPMLTGRHDWCLSRQRTWGVPIFDSGDILDVWFDSGLTWNVLGGRQADLYLEGNDQHRGWFQSSLWLSVALAGRAPYKQVVTHGFVVDQQGQKMAKSKGNVISPLDVVKKYGAEVLRYWVASVDYTKDLQISDEIIKRAAEGYKKLRNTLRFLVANLGDKEPPSVRPVVIDRWIYCRSREVFDEVHRNFEDQMYYAGMQKLVEYINNDLSAIYMNAAKDRLYCGSGAERDSAVVVMFAILRGLLELIAPLFTYTAQEVLSYCPSWFVAGRDIFDFTYDGLGDVAGPHLDERYWKAVLEAFHVHFDRLKAEGKVRDTLEVVLEGPQFFPGAEDWFVVSGVGGPFDTDSLVEFDVGENHYRIVRSALNKCQRCWKRNAVEELCPRCQRVVQQFRT